MGSSVAAGTPQQSFIVSLWALGPWAINSRKQLSFPIYSDKAVELVEGLSGRAGESLPFLIIAAKDDLGMSNELEAQARRRTIRRLMLAGGVLVTSAASVYAGYKIYKSLSAAQANSSSTAAGVRRVLTR
eukprot:gene13161-13291_t